METHYTHRGRDGETEEEAGEQEKNAHMGHLYLFSLKYVSSQCPEVLYIRKWLVLCDNYLRLPSFIYLFVKDVYVVRHAFNPGT